MDDRRFDRLTRQWSHRLSRRANLRLVPVMAALFGARIALPGNAATAKGKGKKVTLCHAGQTITVGKKAKKGHLKHGDTLGACPTPPPPPSPPAALVPPAPPPPPAAACPVGENPCRESCIPSNQCCTNNDCPLNPKRCCFGTCLRPSECCGSDECPEGMVCENGGCLCAPDTVTCGDLCCESPAGIPVVRVRCDQTETCQCDFRLSEVCEPGCPFTNVFDIECDNPQVRGILNALCGEFGC